MAEDTSARHKAAGIGRAEFRKSCRADFQNAICLFSADYANCSDEGICRKAMKAVDYSTLGFTKGSTPRGAVENRRLLAEALFGDRAIYEVVLQLNPNLRIELIIRIVIGTTIWESLSDKVEKRRL